MVFRHDALLLSLSSGSLEKVTESGSLLRLMFFLYSVKSNYFRTHQISLVGQPIGDRVNDLGLQVGRAKQNMAGILELDQLFVFRR